MTTTLQDKLEHLYGLRLHAARYSNDDTTRTRDSTSIIHDDFRNDYKTLLERLGNPHLSLPPVIHVAGTNGKGSTVVFLRAIAEAAGKRVHTYTSPHLVKFNERIVIAGEMISDTDLENILDEVMRHSTGLEVTFFEVATVMAFTIFARIPADLALIEVGMGGRMDCTNIIPAPLATIITRISYDHTQYLGESLADIAREKAGIIKPGVPCIIGYQQDTLDPIADLTANPTTPHEVLDVFTRRARQCGAPLHRAGIEWDVQLDPAEPGIFTLRYDLLLNRYPTPTLVGAHQLQNAGAALACVMALRNRESDPRHPLDPLSIHPAALSQGLIKARWPARLQRLDHDFTGDMLPGVTEIWLDGGHNDSAASTLAAQAKAWHDLDAAPLHLVIAMKRDKNPDHFLRPLLPHATSITFIPLPGMAAQSHEPATLAQRTQALHPGLKVKTAPDLQIALDQIALDQITQSPGKKRLLITGSLFLAGAVLAARRPINAAAS